MCATQVLWFVFTLFCGLLFKPEDVIWPLRIFDYLSPMRFSFASITWAFIMGPDYDGAKLCNVTAVAGCVDFLDPATGLGFHCPADDSGNGCYGVTGEQVLRSLSLRFPALTADATWSQDLGKLFGFVAIVKMLHAFALAYQLSQVALPSMPSSSSSGGSSGGDARVSMAASANAVVHEAVGVVTSAAAAAEAAMHLNRPTPKPPSSLMPRELIRVQQPSFRSFEVRDEAAFVFDSCSYTVMVPAQDEKRRRVPKVLLDNVSGAVNAGSVLAIMGPSGAGKTTLLNLLMLEKMGGVGQGSVTLGGHDFTLAKYNEYACVVQQSDLLWWPLSPRDHIWFAVQLCQPQLGLAEQRQLVEELITNTGLASCQNTRAGNEFFKGLSGGQKRRLSVAIALAKRPHVLFLDEPTSGLDAAAAASIMHHLQEIAAAERMSILCTIHQPSTGVFNGFDEVLFLTGGRVAYIGAAARLSTFLETLGKPVPASANPADFMLDLINRFVDPIRNRPHPHPNPKVARLCSIWSIGTSAMTRRRTRS